MNKLLVLTLVTMIAHTSMAQRAPVVTKGRTALETTNSGGKATVARPLEKLAAHENLIKLEKKGINTTNLRLMVDNGSISADALKIYSDMLDSSTVSPDTKASIRNILEVLGNEKDVLGAKGNRLKAIETYKRFVTDIAPALLKEGNNADVIDLLTGMGSLVVKEGASVAIYRTVGKKYKIDGDAALAKINEFKICKI